MGGGPGTSANGGYGAEIDSADVVVRANRISSPNYADKVGARTDIVFMDACHPEEDGGFDLFYVGGETGHCALASGECPFNGVVFKGNTFISEEDCSGETQNPRDLILGSRTSVPFYGVESDMTTTAVYQLRHFDGEGNRKPTTGFHAVVTFGLACRSLRLYGFEGSTSLDGHEIAASHGLEEEHVVLQALLDPALPFTLDDPLLSQHVYLYFKEAWAAKSVTLVC